MAELLQAVNGIGGRLVRQGDLVVVDAPDDAVTDEIQAAVNDYQSALLELLPDSTATNSDDDEKLDQEMEDFIDKLVNIDPMQSSNGRFTKSWLESSPGSKA